MHNLRHIFKALIISALFGLAVFLITTVTVWRSTGIGYYNNYAVQNKTFADMRSILIAIEEYRLKHNVAPPELKIVANKIDTATNFYRTKIEAKPGDLLYDGYGNRYIYTTTGTSYTLTSLGRDGKPGGKGYDSEIIYADNFVESENMDYNYTEMPGYARYWSLP